MLDNFYLERTFSPESYSVKFLNGYLNKGYIFFNIYIIMSIYFIDLSGAVNVSGEVSVTWDLSDSTGDLSDWYI